jgi:uncharacterized NAD(P)/FAD-binding protein YdhS
VAADHSPRNDTQSIGFRYIDAPDPCGYIVQYVDGLLSNEGDGPPPMLTTRHGAARRPERPTVAIVGAGASGTLTAAQLLRFASRRRTPLRAVLIDRRQQIGGIAYSTDDPRHRLNVASERMSALSEEPEHFLRWRSAGTRDPGEYAPRGDYRRYLEDVLAAAQREAAPEAALRARDGHVSGQLFTLGPPRIGELYETTAIPEIRDQARDLAATLVDALCEHDVASAPLLDRATV